MSRSLPPPLARAGIALFLLFAVLLLLWPLPLALLRGELLGHPVGDLADHVQGAWWFGEELKAGRLPVRTSLSHIPELRPLWYVDPVGALVMLLLSPLGVVASWNLLLLGQALLSTGVGFACGRDLTGSRTAGLVAAAVAGPSPYLLGLLHGGLSEYIGLAPVIGACWACLRATGRDPRGRPVPRWMPVLAGVLVAASGWQAFYYAAFTGLFLLCCLPGAGWPGRVRSALLALGVAGILLLPPLLAMGWTLMQPGAAVGRENAPGWGGGDLLPATDLLTFVAPFDYYFPDTPRLGNPGILHVNTLGWVALGLAVLGLVGARREQQATGVDLRRILLPIGLYAILMLGPALLIAGRPIGPGKGGTPLPLALLYMGPSPFSLVHHPYRMVSVGMALLGFVAAIGSLRLPARARPVLGLLVLVETALLSPAPWPLATTPLPDPAPYSGLPAGAVLDWPPDATAGNRQYQLAQLQHGRPVPYGVNVFLPEPLRRDPLLNQLLRALDDPRRRAHNRDVPFQGDPVPTPEAGPSRLGSLGIGSLVLHRRGLSERELARSERILGEAYGEPLRADGQVIVWAIPAPPVPLR